MISWEFYTFWEDAAFKVNDLEIYIVTNLMPIVFKLVSASSQSITYIVCEVSTDMHAGSYQLITYSILRSFFL